MVQKLKEQRMKLVSRGISLLVRGRRLYSAEVSPFARNEVWTCSFICLPIPYVEVLLLKEVDNIVPIVSHRGV